MRMGRGRQCVGSAALRDAGVRGVALRAVTLSADGLGTISDMIEAIARREANAERAG
ncbi:hypothetical protein [Kitasatospora sp. NPDC093558]|uniref:hypothetical protein n=1 Tax=Kitasatospora sp. NPDC093558 TaxID=3155201 RepID=UPI003421598C